MESLPLFSHDTLRALQHEGTSSPTFTLSSSGQLKRQNLLGRAITLIRGAVTRVLPFVKVNGIDERDSRVISAFSRQVDLLERVPVGVNASNGEQAPDFALITQVLNELREHYTGASGRKTQAALSTISQRVLGLQYRIEAEHGGVNRIARDRIDTEKLDRLVDLASAWRQRHFEVPVKEATELDRHRLAELCQYPDYADMVIQDAFVREQFFKWAVRGGLSTEAFVEFPATRETLMRCYLDKRVSNVGHEGLQFARDAGKKDLTLLMEGKQVSILDPTKTYVFKNNYAQTITQIFNTFAHKNDTVGNLEYTADGIINWNSFEHGSYDPETNSFKRIDYTQDKWWEQIPRMPSLTSEQIEHRYGQKLGDDEYAMGAMGARQNNSLHALNCHGWVEILVPNGDGTHQLYSFGKFAAVFPQGQCDYAQYAGGTFPCRIMTPEEGPMNIGRQKAGHLMNLAGPEQMAQVMNMIRDDIQRAQAGHLYFQFLGDNCASWVQTLFDRTFGEDTEKFYRQNFWEQELTGPLGKLYNTINSIKIKPLRRLAMRITLLVLGGRRRHDHPTEGTLSIFNTYHWNNEATDNPAMGIHRSLGCRAEGDPRCVTQ